MSPTTSVARARQRPLRARYRNDPSAALVVEHARTTGESPDDPFHCAVEPAPGHGVVTPIAVHRALGGPHDAPTPGDILCAALAACLDTSLRMVANVYGIPLEHVAVEVEGDLDVRGTLGMGRDVPVGFQALRCRVHLRAAAGTPPEDVRRLLVSAERACVVLQTLRGGVTVDTSVAPEAPGDGP
jgi:uncharacterized OsmC-like protein